VSRSECKDKGIRKFDLLIDQVGVEFFLDILNHQEEIKSVFRSSIIYILGNQCLGSRSGSATLKLPECGSTKKTANAVTCFPADRKLILWSSQPILWGRNDFLIFKMCKYCFCVVSVYAVSA